VGLNYVTDFFGAAVEQNSFFGFPKCLNDIIIIMRSVDSRGPLHQPRVATMTSLGPFGMNAEGCTIADLLDP